MVGALFIDIIDIIDAVVLMLLLSPDIMGFWYQGEFDAIAVVSEIPLTESAV